MNSLEKCIFDMHENNINTKYEDFAKRIMSEQTADTLSIVYATDTHYIRKYAMYLPSYYKIKEMVEFTAYAGIDLLAITGDLVDGNTTIQRQYRDLYDLVSLVRQSKTTSVVLSKGNHDDCAWYAYQHKLGEEAFVSEEQWYNHVVNPIRVQYPIVVDNENPTGGYYYVDYPLQKIRVININSNDVVNEVNNGVVDNHDYCSQWCLGVREKQLKWLKKALTFEEEGWSVLFMSHDAPVDYPAGDGSPFHNKELLWQMIVDFKNNGKGILKKDEKYFEADLEYDFTNNKSNDVLPYIFGHCHEDILVEKDGIKLVASKNIIHSTSPNFDNLETTIDGGWDCILVDKVKRTFKARRFGMPEQDREFEF